MKHLFSSALAAVLLASAAGPACAQAAPPQRNERPAAAKRPVSKLKVRLFRQKDAEGRVVELTGRKGNDIYYKMPDVSREGMQAIVDISTISKADFELQYDEFAVSKHAGARQWTDAAGAILKAVSPALPFLDFPSNNVARPAMEAAGYLLRDGIARLLAGGEGGRGKADASLRRSYDIFRQVSELKWFELSARARLKAIWCLAAIGELDAALEQFGMIRICDDPKNPDYGLYWLVQGIILYNEESYEEAMDAAVRSLVFSNKDMETFPDALLLSADCYFELQEMYRSRDVYYEIARIFDQSDWSDAARARLALIMNNNLTGEKERADYWKTFIDVKEDMNALARECLGGAVNPPVTDVSETVKSAQVSETVKSTQGNVAP